MPQDKCKFCDDPVCLDDFVTGDCPVEEEQLDCGCIALVDQETGVTFEIIHQCEECGAEFTVRIETTLEYYSTLVESKLREGCP